MTQHTPAEAVQYWYDAATERREERDRLRAAVARIGQMADAWEQQLPEVIRTPAVVSAIRAALEPAAALPAPDQQAAVTPPPALTEEGRLRARVEVLQQDAERDQGLAKVGARCMREGHQGLIEQGRAVIEGHRFALSVKLDLGTAAPWDAIHERVAELRRLAGEAQQDRKSTAEKAADLGLTDTEYRARSHVAAVATVRAAIPGMYAHVGFRLEDVLNEADATARSGQPETAARCPDAFWLGIPEQPHTWWQSPTHPRRPCPGVPEAQQGREAP